MRKNILDYTEKELEEELLSLYEPAYRAKQIFKGIYSSGWKQFSEFTTLTKSLRNQLDEKFSINNINEITSIQSKIDGTTKFLWELSDKNRIESVIIYEGKRVTFCISSQVGCALDCKFCATGNMGIIRNLTPGEIIEQVLRMKKKSNFPPTNIVFMGMGEPMLNYNAVMQASDILSDSQGLCFSRKKITISTSGIIKNIYRMADESRPYSLAISLNSVDQETRKKIMPVSRKYPIDKLIEAAKYYTEKTGKRVTFEYVLIKNINSTLEDAKKLIELTQGIPCKINVIPCNSNDLDFQPPSWEEIDQFDRYINKSNRTLTVRYKKGWEIKAACGQLYTANKAQTM